MNFKLLLNNNNGNDTPEGHNNNLSQQQQHGPASSSSSSTHLPVQTKPTRFSIDSMINNDSQTNSNIPPPLTTPHLPPTNAIGRPSLPSLPGRTASPLASIAKRPSINSLTNDNDIDMKGNETPSFTRISATSNSSSVNNSPVVTRPSLPLSFSSASSFHHPQPPQPALTSPTEGVGFHNDQRNVLRSSPPNILNDDRPPLSSFSSRKASSIASLLSNDTPEQPQPVKREFNSISNSTQASASFAPPTSHKTKSITEELKHLEQLEKKTVIKPKKYVTPPIWAQNWIALVSDKQKFHTKHNGHVNGEHSVGTNYAGIERAKQSYSDNLDVSITKVIPYEDLTRKVTQWLYSHLSDIKQNEPELLEYIELELKLGRIWNKELDARIDFPISTETILTDQVNFYFKPGVENSMYVKLEDFLLKNNAKSGGKNLKVLKSDTVDFFYHGIRRQDKPYDLRVSQDKDTRRIINQIEKRRVGDLFIYNPSNILDFRLSLSLEIPIKDIPKAISKESPNLKRRKIRTSYLSDSCKDRFDLTKTYTFHQPLDPANKPEQNFEVEIEIDPAWVLETFNNLFVSTDNQTYEDSIKVLLDNARILNRSLS